MLVKGNGSKTRLPERYLRQKSDKNPRKSPKNCAEIWISCLEGKTLAEIEAPHIGIGDNLVGAAMRQHLAGMDDIGAIDQAERLAYVVVCDQDADAARREMADELLDVGDGDRVDAGEGSSSSM